MKFLQHLATDSDWGRFVWMTGGGVENGVDSQDDSREFAERELHEETQERINLLQTEVEHQQYVDTQADQNMDEFIKKLERFGTNPTKSQITSLSEHSILLGEKMGKDPEWTKLSKEGKTEVYNLYRTEAVARMHDEMVTRVTDGRMNGSVASALVERIMSRYPSRKDPSGALLAASRMAVLDFEELPLDKTQRMELSKKMTASKVSVKPVDGKIDWAGKKYEITECEILVGSGMQNVDKNLLGSCIFKNVVSVGETEDGAPILLVAQMENGCEGNLVVIRGKTEKREPIEPMDNLDPNLDTDPGGDLEIEEKPKVKVQLICEDGTAVVGFHNNESVKKPFDVDLEAEGLDIGTQEGKEFLAKQMAENAEAAREKVAVLRGKMMKLVDIMQKRMDGGSVEGGALGLLDAFKPKDADLKKAGFSEDEITKFNEHFDKAWVEGEKKIDEELEKQADADTDAAVAEIESKTGTNIAPEARKEIARDMTEKMAKTKEYLGKDLAFWAMGVGAAGLAVALAPAGAAVAVGVGTILAAMPLGNIKLSGYKLNELPGLNEVSEAMLGVKYTDALDAAAKAEVLSQAADQNLAKNSAEQVTLQGEALDDYLSRKNSSLLDRSEQMITALNSMENAMKGNFADLLGDDSEGGDKLNELKMLKQTSTKLFESGKEFRQAIKALKENPNDVMAAEKLESLQTIIDEGFDKIEKHFADRFGFELEGDEWTEVDENGEWKVPAKLPFNIDGVEAIALMDGAGHWTGNVEIDGEILNRDEWKKQSKGKDGWKKAYRKIRKACDKKQLDERLKLIQQLSGIKHVIEVNKELHEDREEIQRIFDNGSGKLDLIEDIREGGAGFEKWSDDNMSYEQTFGDEKFVTTYQPDSKSWRIAWTDSETETVYFLNEPQVDNARKMAEQQPRYWDVVKAWNKITKRTEALTPKMEDLKDIEEATSDNVNEGQDYKENVKEAAAWAMFKEFGSFEDLLCSESARYFLAGGESLSANQQDMLLADDFDEQKFIESGVYKDFPKLAEIHNYYTEINGSPYRVSQAEKDLHKKTPEERVDALEKLLDGNVIDENIAEYQEFTMAGMPRGVAYEMLQMAAADPSILLASGFSEAEVDELAGCDITGAQFEEFFQKAWKDPVFRQMMHDLVRETNRGDILEGCDVQLDLKSYKHTDDTRMGKKHKRIPVSYAMIKSFFELYRDIPTKTSREVNVASKVEGYGVGQDKFSAFNDSVANLTAKGRMDALPKFLKSQGWSDEMISQAKEFLAGEITEEVFVTGIKNMKQIVWDHGVKTVFDGGKAAELFVTWLAGLQRAAADPIKPYREE